MAFNMAVKWSPLGLGYSSIFKRVYQMKKYAEMVLVAWVAVAIGKKLPVIQNYL